MSDLLVFTSEYSIPPTDAGMLRESCTANGIVLQSFGLGQNWPGYGARLRDSGRFLAGQSSRYALFVDSADTLILEREEEILNRFRSLDCPFLFSAERNCWPDPALSHYFSGELPFRFLNAGAWMGHTKWIAERWERIWSQYLPVYPQDDTRMLVQAWIDGMLSGAKIDSGCRIFWSAAGGGLDDLSVDRRTLLEKGTRPAVAHFNGRTAGREEMWRGRIV